MKHELQIKATGKDWLDTVLGICSCGWQSQEHALWEDYAYTMINYEHSRHLKEQAHETGA